MDRFYRPFELAPIAIATIAAFVCEPRQSFAQSEMTAQVCGTSGACAPLDPLTALVIVGVKTVIDELNKGKEGFGPNGELVKAVNTVLGDLKRGGLGPNNDLVKAFETAKSDIINGPGENNDIVKFFKGINIKF
ncbi:hypothetical protein JVX98_12900 [Ensifer sp. PDNC004]|uniref:hypothetical protein n=1 Tax=Ensifer sp. PDNC004 TaxID=2811423 RepID=UPI001962FCDD|nr:hypothetical protein [Ensifer sp. PDNC004]QRY69121.1 hypothetical protein JVX98_12900 [Ensifer sp. PDNC004]